MTRGQFVHYSMDTIRAWNMPASQQNAYGVIDKVEQFCQWGGYTILTVKWSTGLVERLNADNVKAIEPWLFRYGIIGTWINGEYQW